MLFYTRVFRVIPLQFAGQTNKKYFDLNRNVNITFRGVEKKKKTAKRHKTGITI